MNKECICEVLEENNIDILRSEEDNIINIMYEFDDVEISGAKSFSENKEEIKNFLVEIAKDNLVEILEEIEEDFNINCNLKEEEYIHLNCIKYTMELIAAN